MAETPKPKMLKEAPKLAYPRIKQAITEFFHGKDDERGGKHGAFDLADLVNQNSSGLRGPKPKLTDKPKQERTVNENKLIEMIRHFRQEVLKETDIDDSIRNLTKQCVQIVNSGEWSRYSQLADGVDVNNPTYANAQLFALPHISHHGKYQPSTKMLLAWYVSADHRQFQQWDKKNLALPIGDKETVKDSSKGDEYDNYFKKLELLEALIDRYRDFQKEKRSRESAAMRQERSRSTKLVSRNNKSGGDAAEKAALAKVSQALDDNSEIA